MSFSNRLNWYSHLISMCHLYRQDHAPMSINLNLIKWPKWQQNQFHQVRQHCDFYLTKLISPILYLERRAISSIEIYKCLSENSLIEFNHLWLCSHLRMKVIYILTFFLYSFKGLYNYAVYTKLKRENQFFIDILP